MLVMHLSMVLSADRAVLGFWAAALSDFATAGTHLTTFFISPNVGSCAFCRALSNGFEPFLLLRGLPKPGGRKLLRFLTLKHFDEPLWLLALLDTSAEGAEEPSSAGLSAALSPFAGFFDFLEAESPFPGFFDFLEARAALWPDFAWKGIQ